MIRAAELELALAIVEKERRVAGGAGFEAIVRQDERIVELLGRSAMIRGLIPRPAPTPGQLELEVEA